MNTSFSIEAALRFGWETFKKRPGFFVGVTVILAIVSAITSGILSIFGEDGAGRAAGELVNFLIMTLLDLGITATLLKAYDSVDKVEFADLWHPARYGTYLVSSIIVAVAVGIWFALALILGPVGVIIAIIPAVVISLMLMFTRFIVVDRGMGAVDAIKESVRITEGNRLQLFLFMIVIAVVNLLGVVALLVGLLVTIPVSGLAVVYVYRTIGHKASEIVAASPAAEPAPAV